MRNEPQRGTQFRRHRTCRLYKDHSYSTVRYFPSIPTAIELRAKYVLVRPINHAHPYVQLGSALLPSSSIVMASGCGLTSSRHSNTIGLSGTSHLNTPTSRHLHHPKISSANHPKPTQSIEKIHVSLIGDIAMILLNAVVIYVHSFGQTLRESHFECRPSLKARQASGTKRVT